MQTNALKNCNVLPFTKEEPSSTKALKATILMVAVSAFVVGLLAVLATQNVFACGLSQIGAAGAGCMMGAGALLFLALYYFRKAPQVIPQKPAYFSEPTGAKPTARAVTNPANPPVTLIDKVERLGDAEFLALSLKEFSDDTSNDHHPLIEALCHRFHTTTVPKKTTVNTYNLTLGDLPSLSGLQILIKLKDNTFPRQLLICLSSDQVRALDDETWDISNYSSSFDGQKLLANHLFQMNMGFYCDQHLRKMYPKMRSTLDFAVGATKMAYFKQKS